MDEKNKQTKQKKEKVCPLNPGLKCEDCKFFVTYPGGGGKKTCAFLRMVSYE